MGVELGQLLALGIVLLLVHWWRRAASFGRLALFAHFLALTAGFTLAGYQLAGYFHSRG